MEEKIKKIMANVFLIEESQIEKYASPAEIIQWDSIGHLNLITSLEEEFDIVFTDEQIIEMLNLPLVIEITKEALKNK